MEAQNQFSENRGPGFIFWVLLGVIIALIIALLPLRARAQKPKPVYDTIQCKNECIVKYVTTEEKVKILYIDKEIGIEEIIPVSKTVRQYIFDCKQNGLKPSLGIKLKNGEISSIIRLKTKYRRVKR